MVKNTIIEIKINKKKFFLNNNILNNNTNKILYNKITWTFVKKVLIK